MIDETYSTLQFASRASKIKTIVKPAASEFLQFQSTGNMTLERAKKEIALLRDHITHLESAQLKKIEQANNPALNVPEQPCIDTNRADIKELCDQISSILTTREEEKKQGTIVTECSKCDVLSAVLIQCQAQIKELFGLWTKAVATSRNPPEQDVNGGYSSDHSQLSLTLKSGKDTIADPPKKKKSKKLASKSGVENIIKHDTPSKRKQQGESAPILSVSKQATLNKTKRKAASAPPVSGDKHSILQKKFPCKKDKDGVSLPLLKSNSAGTYGKQNSTRVSGVPRPQVKDEIFRQKRSKKKKPVEGLTTMKKLNTQRRTNQNTHNNRYNNQDPLNDDLLGIIDDESDEDESGNGSGGMWKENEDNDDDNDEEIMRRIEEENMKIIQAEDMAREKDKRARKSQLDCGEKVRQSKSRNNGRSEQSLQSPSHNYRDHTIESVLEASRNAVLAANGALGPKHDVNCMPTNTHETSGNQNQVGLSPARHSIDEGHHLGKHQTSVQGQQHHEQHHYQQQFQHAAPSPSQIQAGYINGGMTSSVSNYNINTSYGNYNPGTFAMPPSSIENGAGGFNSKCSKHGLESCVLCTMFNGPSSITSGQHSNNANTAVGFQNNSRPIHSPIRSKDDARGTITGDTFGASKDNYNGSSQTSMTSPPFVVNPGFCSIHHVNDCLLCSLTSQKRGNNAVGSHNYSDISPSRQSASSHDQIHNSRTTNTQQTQQSSVLKAGSPGIGFTPQNGSHLGTYGNTPVSYNVNNASGLNSVGGPNSNTTAPGMFTASPNRQHNFNSYNNSISLASKDGVYAFGKDEPSNVVSTSVVPSQHIPSYNPQSNDNLSAGGSFRSRFPVKSNPISEENENDLGSNHTSRNSVEFQQVRASTKSPKRNISESADSNANKRQSSVEEFEALLNSISSSSSKPKTEAIPSKYANLPSGGGIQFEDESDDVGQFSKKESATKPEPNSGGMHVRTDHRRGNAIHHNSQTGLYEYDYRSNVEYEPNPKPKTPSQQSKAVTSKPKPVQKQLSGAAASAAQVYGSDMSELIPAGKKAKKKQMNRKLFELQKNKTKS